MSQNTDSKYNSRNEPEVIIIKNDASRNVSTTPNMLTDSKSGESITIDS